MNSRLSRKMFSFMLENDIKASPVLAEKAGVGYQWVRSLYSRRGLGNPTCAPLEALHDYLVANHDMSPLIFIGDIEKGESEAA